MPQEPVTTLSDERARHAEASRELVTTLMNVKVWARQLHQWALSDRSNSALLTLAALERTGPARVGTLAELAQVDASVVSRQVAQLEQAGLVERHRDPDDGRAQRLSVTDEGHRVLAESRDRLTAILADRLSGWDAAELETVSDSLRRLLDDLTLHPSRPERAGSDHLEEPRS